MQISRMPIPADNCSNSEIMPVDATNASDTKSDLETTTKLNGDNHKKLNGSTVVGSSNESNETDETSEVTFKEGNVKSDLKEPVLNSEILSQNIGDVVKNGASEEQHDGNIEKTDQEETSLSTTTAGNDKSKDKSEEVKSKVDQNKPNEVVVNKIENPPNENLVIKQEPGTEISNPEIAVGSETRETEKCQNAVHNGEVSQSDEVVKNGEEKLIPVNGRVKVDEDKIIESEKEKIIQKVAEEEDMSSEMSTDALSPKQVTFLPKY